MLRRHLILLIGIRPSDTDVKLLGPLGAFREEQAMSRHRVSPSPFLSSSSSFHTTQLHYTNSYTYSHPNLNFLQYTIQILIPHIMWGVHHCGIGGACAPVMQWAWVRSPVGTSFLGEVFRGFSSPVRRMSGSFRPIKSPNIIWSSSSSSSC